MKNKLFYLPILLICLACIFSACNSQADGSETDTETTLQEGCDHVFSETVTKKATCVSGGEIKIVCRLCGSERTEQTPTDPKSHNFGAWTLEIAPSCTIEGLEFSLCLDCGERQERYLAKDKNSHDPTGWVTVKAPTCLEEGLEEIHCAGGCNVVLDSRAIAVDPDAHICGPIETVASTCTNAGYEKETCSLCNTELVHALPLDPSHHVFSDKYIAVTDGHTICCDGCGAFSEVLPHTPGEINSNDEKHYSVCNMCSSEFNLEEHVWENVVVDPTYTSTGEEYKICTVCGKETDRTVLEELDKLIPEYTLPTLVCEYGSTLGSIALPDGFSFYFPGLFVGEVGENQHFLSYTVPGDTEGKYQTVKPILITITVIPKSIEISYDTASLENAVYTGRPVAAPTNPTAEYAHLVRIRWYEGKTLLDGAPTDAGDYTVELYIEEENYTAETQRYDFTIAKAENPIDESIISDRGYTGLPVKFTIDTEWSISLEHVDRDGNKTDPPTEKGDYFVKVTVAESKNYLQKTFTAPFSIVTDTEAPTWIGDTFRNVDINETSFKLPATDNGAIKYFLVRPYSEIKTGVSYTTTSDIIEIEPGFIYYVEAFDYAGNRSNSLSVVVYSDDMYKADSVFPEDGATLNQSYVALKADWATAFYFGTDPENLSPITGSFIPCLESGVTYYWFAVYGYYSGYIYSFTVNYEGEVPTTLIYPEDNAIITEKDPIFMATSSIPGKIMISRASSDVFSEYSPTSFQLQYGMKYKWCYEYEDGTRSEMRTFTYLCEYGAPEEAISLTVSSNVVGFDNILVKGNALAGVDHISYYVMHPNGENDVSYSTAEGFTLDDGVEVGSIRYLENGDKVVIVAFDENYARSKPIIVTIDMEAPTLGEIEDHGDGKVTVRTGSDNIGALYEYRVALGEWISYTEDTLIDLAECYKLIELRATDQAGNKAYKVHYLGTITDVEAPTLISGKLDTPTNSDVTLSLTPSAIGECCYYVNGEEFPLNEVTELTFDKEGEYFVWTGRKDGASTEYSEPLHFIIDKTAPTLGRIYKQDRWVNVNGEYIFFPLDLTQINDASEWTIEWMLRGVNEEYKPLEDGRVKFYSYYLAQSGIYYVDIRITDGAGNSQVISEELWVDVEGPSLDDMKLEYVYDEQSGETKCLIIFSNIVDDYGYYYHMQLLVWDGDLYDAGVEDLEAFVDIRHFTEPGEDSFVYDATHLEEGKKYYFLAYATDNLINGSYSKFYHFTKETPKDP